MDLCVYSIVVFDVAGMSVCVCVCVCGGGEKVKFSEFVKKNQRIITYHLHYLDLA